MKTKRIAFGFLILTLLACNFVTQLVAPPATVTPLPTASLIVPTTISTSTPSPLVPAYIPPQCASSAPATSVPDIALAQPTTEAEANPRISKSEQLRVFRKMTNTIDQVYVYPDFNGKDWTAIKEKYRAKIEAGLDTNSFYREMRAMVFELGGRSLQLSLTRRGGSRCG
jgi:carboxyl-terminal processing protease